MNLETLGALKYVLGSDCEPGPPPFPHVAKAKLQTIGPNLLRLLHSLSPSFVPSSHNDPRSLLRSPNARNDVPLEALWSFYDDPYGVNVRITLEISELKSVCFVPYLSAMQLYPAKPPIEADRDGSVRHGEDAPTTHSAEQPFEIGGEEKLSTHESVEPIYEFFERIPPAQRKPLGMRIREDLSKHCPLLLTGKFKDLNQRRSWYAVLWQPVLSDLTTTSLISGCFLTFHSFELGGPSCLLTPPSFGNVSPLVAPSLQPVSPGAPPQTSIPHTDSTAESSSASPAMAVSLQNQSSNSSKSTANEGYSQLELIQLKLQFQSYDTFENSVFNPLQCYVPLLGYVGHGIRHVVWFRDARKAKGVNKLQQQQQSQQQQSQQQPGSQALDASASFASTASGSMSSFSVPLASTTQTDASTALTTAPTVTAAAAPLSTSGTPSTPSSLPASSQSTATSPAVTSSTALVPVPLSTTYRSDWNDRIPGDPYGLKVNHIDLRPSLRIELSKVLAQNGEVFADWTFVTLDE